MPLLNKRGGGWSREKSDLPKSSSQKEGDSLELAVQYGGHLSCGYLSLEMQLVWIKMYKYKTITGFWRLSRKYLINIFILIPCWNDNILDILSWINYINKLMSPVLFYFLKMWLLENFKLHLWLTFTFLWNTTVLEQSRGSLPGRGEPTRNNYPNLGGHPGRGQDPKTFWLIWGTQSNVFFLRWLKYGAKWLDHLGS